VLDDNNSDMLKAGVRLSAVGIEIAVCVLLGFGAGYWLDGKFGATPLWTLIGGAMGIAAAAKVVHRLIKQTNLDKL
jgi:F0F1-type ATP synthase assembly protein I